MTANWNIELSRPRDLVESRVKFTGGMWIRGWCQRKMQEFALQSDEGAKTGQQAILLELPPSTESQPDGWYVAWKAILGSVGHCLL